MTCSCVIYIVCMRVEQKKSPRAHVCARFAKRTKNRDHALKSVLIVRFIFFFFHCYTFRRNYNIIIITLHEQRATSKTAAKGIPAARGWKVVAEEAAK